MKNTALRLLCSLLLPLPLPLWPQTPSTNVMVPLGYLVVPASDGRAGTSVRCVGEVADSEDFSDFGGIEKRCDAIVTKPREGDAIVPRDSEFYNLVFVAVAVPPEDPRFEEHLRQSKEFARRLVINCHFHGDYEACSIFSVPTASQTKPGTTLAATRLVDIDADTLWVHDGDRRIKYTIIKQLPPYRDKEK